MKMRLGIGRLRALKCIVVVLFYAQFAHPCTLNAQSSQLHPASQPDALPDIVPSKIPLEVKDKHIPPRALNGYLPQKPTIAPSFTLPVGALGFTAPGPRYLGSRNSLASLDFLSDDHILFTFRVPGLIRRDGEPKDSENEREIQAVVLEVKTGRVEAEALWTVHDLVRYLWMLKDGHFLLRDRDGLEQGDSSLVLKPFLQFPGQVQWLEMDPEQLYMVTNSIEPAKAEAKSGLVDSPPTAAATVEADGQNSAAPADKVVRILERSTGKVMLVSRVRSTVHLPINSDGYLERLRGNGQTWLLNLTNFTGATRILGKVESSCSPVFDFISQSELLVTGCTASGGTRLIALTTDGRRLWDEVAAGTEVWPKNVMSPDGSRLAFETLVVNRPVNAYNPLDFADVKGQLVRIIDAADGNVALEATASPALDAGGNVALSPSGRRAAILIDGAIQVFGLPPAPALPAPSTAPAAH